MSALSDVGNAVFRDISVTGDVRDDPQWRALLGQGRKRRRIKHTPGGHPHNQQDHAGDGVPDVPNPLDKLKLGKLAPAGFRVRSSRKLKTDNADVGVAEVDSPDGPQVRIGVIGNESGKWDAGFTGEARKTQLREEIGRKQELMDSDSDDVDADIEDQISELESELEDLEGERTAIVHPEAMADFRRQLGEAVTVAQANKTKQDATLKALDALDEQRDDVIAEFSDAELESKISKASGYLRSRRDTIKRLENGQYPPHWEPEDVAELLEMHKAEAAKLDAELAPLLARRAEMVPPDALARLEDLDRQYRALTEGDIDDMLTSAEVSAPNGARIRAEIWGSDDADEQWVSTRLYVLAPGETTDDADQNDDYARWSGLKGLNKLIAGLESGDRSKSSRRNTQAKHGSHNQEDHGNRGVDLIPPMAGLPVLDDEQYSKAYGTVLDELSISQADGIGLQVRVFELGDAHIVLDLPGNRHQVMSDFDDSDGMRALAGDIRSMQRAQTGDGAANGDLVTDVTSDSHDYYVAADDLGNIWLRSSDQAEDDYLELSEDEADDLADALDDMADTLDEEFGDGVEIVGGKSLRKHGTHDQRTHGRRRAAAVLDVPDVPAPKPVAEPKPPKPRRAPKPKPPARRRAPKPAEETPAPTTTPRRSDAEIDREIKEIDREMRDVENRARGPLATLARLDKRAADRGLRPADIDAYADAEAEMQQLVTEGVFLANTHLDLLIERDGQPFGGDAPQMPTARPRTSWAGGANQDAARRARSEYVMNDMLTIASNASLRSGNPSPEAKKWRARMAQMTQSQRIDNDSVVYRGAVFKPDTIMKLQPGSVLHDVGTTSTDTSRENAKFYGQRRGLKRPGLLPTLFAIKVPAGTRGYDADADEFVFGPDSSMRILSSRRTDQGIEVTAEMLAPGQG